MQQTGLTAQAALAALAALAQQLTGRRAETAIRMTAAQAQTTLQRIQQLIHPIKKCPVLLEDRAFLRRKKLRHISRNF